MNRFLRVKFVPSERNEPHNVLALRYRQQRLRDDFDSTTTDDIFAVVEDDSDDEDATRARSSMVARASSELIEALANHSRNGSRSGGAPPRARGAPPWRENRLIRRKLRRVGLPSILKRPALDARTPVRATGKSLSQADDD
jgi:hypothetical protein